MSPRSLLRSRLDPVVTLGPLSGEYVKYLVSSHDPDDSPKKSLDNLI